MIHRVVGFGVNLLDTTDRNGCGENERLVGRAIKGRRRALVLTTRFWNVRDERGNFLGVNGAPDYARQCCDTSLRRLRRRDLVIRAGITPGTDCGQPRTGSCQTCRRRFQ